MNEPQAESGQPPPDREIDAGSGEPGLRTKPIPQTRIYQLDAVRGVLAIGVMVYHTFPWTPTFFGTWGVYAFFVLSGWALEYVYGHRFVLRSFIAARIARLAPLWFPVILVAALIGGRPDPGRILLNLTGLFGFLDPGATSGTSGGWSIGIEIVCYVLFVALAWRRLPTLTLALLMVGLIALRSLWNGGFLVTPTVAGWVHYTVAPSFLCFFVAGMLAARMIRLPHWSGWRARIATALGDLSYGTYLLHPLVAIAIGPWTLLVTPALALGFHSGEVRIGRAIKSVIDPRRPLATGLNAVAASEMAS